MPNSILLLWDAKCEQKAHVDIKVIKAIASFVCECTSDMLLWLVLFPFLHPVLFKVLDEKRQTISTKGHHHPSVANLKRENLTIFWHSQGVRLTFYLFQKLIFWSLWWVGQKFQQFSVFHEGTFHMRKRKFFQKISKNSFSFINWTEMAPPIKLPHMQNIFDISFY